MVWGWSDEWCKRRLWRMAGLDGILMRERERMAINGNRMRSYSNEGFWKLKPNTMNSTDKDSQRERKRVRDQNNKCCTAFNNELYILILTFFMSVVVITGKDEKYDSYTNTKASIPVRVYQRDRLIQHHKRVS